MILKVEASDSGEIILERIGDLGISEVPVLSSLSVHPTRMHVYSEKLFTLSRD